MPDGPAFRNGFLSAPPLRRRALFPLAPRSEEPSAFTNPPANPRLSVDQQASELLGKNHPQSRSPTKSSCEKDDSIKSPELESESPPQDKRPSASAPPLLAGVLLFIDGPAVHPSTRLSHDAAGEIIPDSGAARTHHPRAGSYRARYASRLLT